MTDDEMLARLDVLEAQIAQVQMTLDTILSQVTNLVAEAAPMLEKLQTNPLVRMLGGKP